MTGDSAAVPDADFWAQLRATTPSRVGLGRAGDAAPTRAVLEAATAHALARDTVHLPLEVDALLADLTGLAADIGAPTPVVLRSAAPDRETYLTRPDLGRALAAGTALPSPHQPVDLAIVVGDGLSATAVSAHAVPLLRELTARLDPGTTYATPVVALQARVALGDQVALALGARMVLVLIGERPGLSASDSLGAYLTWKPQRRTPDSARNCVSNIRPPHGLDHATAARTLAALMAGARQLGATGVRLKDVDQRPPEI